MSRPKQTSLDPEWFEGSHDIARQTAIEDTYFGHDKETALVMVLLHMVDQLPEPDRSAVNMTVLGRMSHEEAAGFLERDLGKRPNRKTVWRWTQRGLNRLREQIAQSPWLQEMSDKLPLLSEETLKMISSFEDSLNREE